MKISVGKLKKVIKEVLDEKEKSQQQSASVPKCEDCGKKLSAQDKKAYEAEGGKGWPAVCEECAEDAAL